MVSQKSRAALSKQQDRFESAATLSDNPNLGDPDVQTMLRAKSGDDSAFASLVAAYQPLVVKVLTPVLGNAESAEDVAQEVFFRIYQARHKYIPTAKFATWLFCIAHNLAFNRRRDDVYRRREINSLVSPNAKGVSPLENSFADKSGMMPQRLCDRSELQTIVAAAVETLSVNQRRVVKLNKYEGMSYSQIARALGMHASAVKSLLSRARGNLRIALEPYMTAGELGEILGSMEPITLESAKNGAAESPPPPQR